MNAPSHATGSSAGRFRWFSVGLATTLVLGGTIVGAGTEAADADGGGIFVPIAPCRLADTRSTSQVGERGTPIGEAESLPVAVTGTVGNCRIPSDAIGVALNVTAVNATARSYLTVYPSDVPQPLAANLNYLAGAPPTPNKMDVGLSGDGAIRLFNRFGTVDVVVDATGYYADSGVGEVKEQLAGKADAATVYTKSEIEAMLGDAVSSNEHVDALLALKANVEDVATKADADDVYDRAQTDTLLADKADTADVYDRAQTDTLLADKADTVEVYDRTETDTLLADKADTVEVYDRTETDETFLGRDPDVIMRQATSSLVGLLGPLASSLSGTRILAGSGAVSELTGPAALIDPIGGRTDFRLNAVRYCIDDIVLGATVDRVSVSVRDELGVIRTVDDPIDRPAPGCQTIDVTSLRAGVAHYVEFDVVGIGSLNVTSMETEWGAVPDPTSST